MKHEWRKKEKELYLPKTTPQMIEVPPLNYFSIKGEGNPNNAFFQEYIEVLYSLSYAIRMSYKKGLEPKGFFDYTVYPLEGVWSITKEAQKNFTGTIRKDDLVFNLMIRQPSFVNEEYAHEVITTAKKKKPHPLLDQVRFENINEGLCVQMMHIGSYDNEPQSFQLMEEFAEKNNIQRKSKVHREIYISDVRRVAPEKLKTVLRFQTNKV